MNFKWLPFSYHWLLRKACGNKVLSILDVGCGEGRLMKDLSEGENWEITGIDIYSPSLIIAKKQNIYKEVRKVDLRRFPKSLSKTQYDLVFCSQVVEHLSKKDALKIISYLEILSRKRVVISTTVGFMNYNPIEEKRKADNNPFQRHRSAWTPEEFKKRGYRVYGQGLYLVYREGYLGHILPDFLHPALFVFAIILAPIICFFPNLGTYQIAFKDV